MSDQPVANSLLFDDATLALHACTELKTLFRAAAEFGKSLFAAADVRLVLSRGAGLPGIVWKMENGGITETRLDSRWLLGSMAAVLRAKNEPCLLGVQAGKNNPSRLPQALFPGQDIETAVGLPLHAGRHDLHTLIFIGGGRLAGNVGGRGLTLFHRHFRLALERLLAAEAENSALMALRGFVNHSCTGLIALDWELRPLYSNRAAIQLCEAWEKGAEGDGLKSQKGRVSLPEDIFRECVRLKKALAAHKGDDDRPEPMSLVDCPSLSGLRANIRLARPVSVGTRRPFFQVRLERPLGSAARSGNAKAAVSDDIRNFLSPSERELLEVAAEGLSNEEIASRLGKSLATVKSQIQSIYRKLSISNRSELIARLSGFSTARAAR